MRVMTTHEIVYLQRDGSEAQYAHASQSFTYWCLALVCVMHFPGNFSVVFDLGCNEVFFGQADVVGKCQGPGILIVSPYPSSRACLHLLRFHVIVIMHMSACHTFSPSIHHAALPCAPPTTSVNSFVLLVICIILRSSFEQSSRLSCVRVHFTNVRETPDERARSHHTVGHTCICRAHDLTGLSAYIICVRPPCNASIYQWAGHISHSVAWCLPQCRCPCMLFEATL